MVLTLMVCVGLIHPTLSVPMGSGELRLPEAGAAPTLAVTPSPSSLATPSVSPFASLNPSPLVTLSPLVPPTPSPLVTPSGSPVTPVSAGSDPRGVVARIGREEIAAEAVAERLEEARVDLHAATIGRTEAQARLDEATQALNEAEAAVADCDGRTRPAPLRGRE
jgi:hypothetical protein